MLNKTHLSERELWDKVVSLCYQDKTELNRAWIYNKSDNSRIGATIFVMSTENAKQAFEKLKAQNKLSIVYENFHTFLEMYNPEKDGEEMYQYAKENNLLTDDIGEVIYFKG